MFLIDWTTVSDVLCSLPVGWRYTWWYDWVLLRRTAWLPPTASPPMFWVLSGNMHTYISIYWYYSSWNIKRFLWRGINKWQICVGVCTPCPRYEWWGGRSQALTSVLICLRHCNIQTHTHSSKAPLPNQHWTLWSPWKPCQGGGGWWFTTMSQRV